MPARKKKQGLSQTPQAIARREVTRLQREERESAKGVEDSGSTETPSTGTIGVQTPAKPEPEKVQAYHCSNCDGDITRSDAECPICEMTLNWPED